MKHIAWTVLIVFGLMPPATADDGVVAALGDGDRAIIEQVIRSQLEAFKADDSEGAFGYASNGVREKFGTSEAFMLMVRERYQPVYRARAVEFGTMTMSELGPAQHLTVLGPNGTAFTAIYVMERQPDGAWKIAGCLLTPRDAKTA
jgi:hypothetical protein